MPVSYRSFQKLPEFSIIVSERGGAENRTRFDTDEVGIGRVQGNELVLPKGNVSKRHARISYVEGRFVVADLNSTNGTYVNRRRISQSTIVRFGDRIYIGDFVLRIEDPSAPYETASDRVREIQESIPDFSDQTVKTNAVTSAAVSSVQPAAVVDSPPSMPEEAAPATGTVSTGEFDALSIEDGTASFGPRAHQLLRELAARLEQKFDASVPGVEATDAIRRRALQSAQEAWRAMESDGVVEGGWEFQSMLVERAVSELVDAGALGQIWEDPAVTQIVASGDHSLVIWRDDLRRHEVPFSSPESLLRAVRRACARRGGGVPGAERAIERTLDGGIRLSCAVSEDGTRALAVRAWRQVFQGRSFDGLVLDGTLSRGMATFIRQCVVHRANLLVVGSQLGVQRLLGAASDVAEGHCIVVHSGSAFCQGRPDASRLDAATEGIEGSVAQLSAIEGVRLFVERWSPTSSRALYRGVAGGADGILVGAAARSFRRWWSRAAAELTTLGLGLDVPGAQRWICSAFDVAIEVVQLADERFRVMNVFEVSARADGSPALAELFRFEVERTAAGGVVEGAFRPTGTVPELFAEFKERGISVDHGVFRATR